MPLLLTVVAFPAVAAVGDHWTESQSSHKLYMRKVADSMGNRQAVIEKVTSTDETKALVVPSNVSNGVISYEIVGIDNAAMKDCKMTEIDLQKATYITSIGNFAFARNTNLTTVYLPHTLISLGTNAFDGCTALSDVKGGLDDQKTWLGLRHEGKYIAQSLPINITSIPRSTFRNCTSLTNFSINGAATAIGDSAFVNCSKLTKIGYWNFDSDNQLWTSPDAGNYLPQNCASVGNYAFAGTKFANLYMPNLKLQTIGNGAFRSTNLLKKIGNFVYSSPSATVTYTDNWLPNALTSIGNSAFQFSGIETVNMNNNVTSLGYYCFDQCSNLASVTLSTGLTTLPTRAFNQTALTTINTRNVTYIDQFAFSETKITSLTNFNIPKVEEIVNGAFSDISTLTKVEFPSTIKVIGTIAFRNCPNLKLVDFQLVKKNVVATTDGDGVFVNSTAFDATQKANARLYVPFGYEESFYSAAGTKDFAFKPIVGGGTFAHMFAYGKIDADKHYHYVITTTGEMLHGIETFGDNALLVRDENSVIPFTPQGSLENYPSLSQLTGSDNFEYSRYPWYIFQGLGKANAGSLLSGNICLEIVDRVNPTVRFDSGYDINHTTYEPVTKVATLSGGEDLVKNIYCPANFVAQDKYYFIDPIACEIATIKWAVLAEDGNMYILARKKADTGEVYNDERVEGGFAIDTQYLTGGGLDENNAAYEIEAMIVKRPGIAFAPDIKGNVKPSTGKLSDDYIIYPLAVKDKVSIITAIDDIKAHNSQVKSVHYVNAAGIAADRPFSGLNIVVTTYSDGTSSTVKAVF